MKLVVFILVYFRLFCLIADVHSGSDGVEIESEFEDQESTTENLKRLKRNTDNFLKKYIDNLKNGQEIVLSSGTGFSGTGRFKTGDIHIKKEESFKKSPEVSESAQPKYSYPFGLGTFLMSGCFRYSSSSKKNNQDISNSNDYDNDDYANQTGDYRRKKRAVQSKKNVTNDMESMCAKYFKLEEAIECQKIIPGAYTLGTGFDIKFENNENSRRKSVVTRYCNHKKVYDGHSVPDIMTANGIYDTKTQTMTFGESSDYMRFVASKSNLDRYSNIFKSDKKSAYGGLEGQHVGPGNQKLDEDSLKENNKDKKATKTQNGSDFYLFQIQSTILIYDLILDQINAWNLDPEFLIDFLFLPESYFYYNAPVKFEKFILRYGTHVVVSAKFGGEFKIMNTMRKSKATSIESFAEKATQDSMKMFSRTITEKANILIMNHEISKTKSDQEDSNKHKEKNAKNVKAQTNEYFSSYISVKGGSQEVAAIVANLGQPDFSDSFIGWLDSVYKYPRAFDFKYESIVSILDIDVRTLFAQLAVQEENVCSETLHRFCYFGFTLEDFVDKWEKKRRALQFAITIYLKEPHGLTLNKFFIKKGNSDCRFNILNYLSPYWSEIVSGKQEFHITFNFNEDEPPSNLNQSSSRNFLFFKTDEVFFIKRDEFWLAKRKGSAYTYESARLLTEPFKSTVASRKFVNILGLVLEYNEVDATVSVVDLNNVIAEYAVNVGCSFSLDNLADLQNLVTVDCGRILKTLRINLKNIKNLDNFWSNLKGKVIGVVDYVDPIKSVIRAWDLKYAVLPCQLKWSNNLMMVLPKTSKDEGKCLKFTAATEGELFLVIATTPSNQNTWYIFQITTKGVIFYREGLPLLLNEDSAAGTTGNKNIYQNFFVCFNYEERKLSSGDTTRGLFIQYGIQISSNEISHLYLSYFDTKPLDPIYYSFGSRNADVQILNAHLDNFNVDEQIKLRCSLTSTLNKATSTNFCDYKCHPLCDGCTQPYSVYACKQCSTAKMMFNSTKNFLCVEKCAQGYEADLLNSKICVDMNECSTGVHECQSNAKCVNTIGSYRCECSEGFEGNGMFCEDINECALETHSCSSKAACVNLPGSFKCQCSSGFINISSICVDIDECALNTHNCSWNQICHNTIGSYKCLCPIGFQDSSQTGDECTEINECLIYNNTCPVFNSHCQNTFGSYECLCPQGFIMYNNACQDINECYSQISNNCDLETQRCVNTNGSFFCECNEGLVSYLHNGLVYCADLKKSHSGINDCVAGYYREGENCVDINECHLSTHDCDSGSYCINSEGGFYCQCLEGFQFNELESGKASCVDIDECEIGKYDCSLPDMICVNTYGSYYCQCDTLDLFEAESTIDHRKCLSEQESSGINVNCQVVNKILVCVCETGFARQKYKQGLDVLNFTRNDQNNLDPAELICEDIDECQDDPFICGPNSVCMNQYGSYSCECQTGYVPNYSDGFLCEDYNECSSSCSNDCDRIHASCINLSGSFKCVCNPGFSGTGKTGQCFDINECNDFPDKCNINAFCSNTVGGFECKCRQGFAGNGTICENINECVDLEMEKACRIKNSKCVDLLGSYECQCFDGYYFDKHTNKCTDIDECFDLSVCGADTLCLNVPGSFTCACADGFKWSSVKRFCEDINECVMSQDISGMYSSASSVCDDHSICVNTAGSYRCDCKSGWNKTKNNDYCSDINECHDEKNKDNCSDNSVCHNLPGSYECRCLGGFIQVPSDLDKFKCVDVNECETKNICQDVYHRCVNTIGGYRCECISGFVADINGVCIDLNECEQSHLCGQNSVCMNLLGSFKCDCLLGFEKMSLNSTECVDINECDNEGMAIVNTCHRYSACTNSYGSYNCTCLSGFKGDGRLCIDIDECGMYANPDQILCNNTGKCVNTVGYYMCDCMNGYTMDKNSNLCVDLNECEFESCFSSSVINTTKNSNLCYSFGLCRNMIGSFMCECFDGFEFDHSKGHCVDVDECKKLAVLGMSNLCQKDGSHMQECENLCGSYTCSCKESKSTVVDIYNSTRCYSRKQRRDVVVYIDVDRNENSGSSFNIFAKDLNVTVEACQTGLRGNFELKLILLEESGSESEHWLPVSVDNKPWIDVEFVCRMSVDYELLLESGFDKRNLQYVMIEDPIRSTCSVFKRTTKKNLGHSITKISYEINSVWVISIGEETCESSLEVVTADKILHDTAKNNELNFLFRNGVGV